MKKYLLLPLLLVGCGQTDTPPNLSTHSPTPILVVGDSLSAAYNIPEEKGWVNLLDQRLKEEGVLSQSQSVANVSQSGQTTEGGLRNFEEALSETQPSVVVIALGGNDGLQRLPADKMKSNLSKMVGLAKDQGAEVVLVGVNLPAKFFFVSTKDFTKSFDDVATEHMLIFEENLLDDVNGNSSFMQQDGLHPNELGQPQMLENVWDEVLQAASLVELEK